MGACTPVSTPTSGTQRDDDARVPAPAQAAVSEPVPDPGAVGGIEPWRTCAARPCVAGVVHVGDSGSERLHNVQFEERIGSAPGHPNADARVSTSLWREGARELEAGSRYWIIAEVGKHRILDAVFIGPPDEPTRAQVEAIFTSPQVLRNDASFQQLWVTLERERADRAGDGDSPDAWAASADGRFVALARANAVVLFDGVTRRRSPVELDGDTVTNVTFEDGRFWLWNRLTKVGCLAASTSAPPSGDPVPVDRDTRAPVSLRLLHEAFARAAKDDEHRPGLPLVWGTNAAHTVLFTSGYNFHLDTRWFGWIMSALSGLPQVDNITAVDEAPTWWHDGRPLDPVW